MLQQDACCSSIDNDTHGRKQTVPCAAGGLLIRKETPPVLRDGILRMAGARW